SLTDEAREYFGDSARVERLVPLAGGASRELYGFDVIAGAERHELVLRRDPPGLEDREARRRELAALAAAYGRRVPVPAPRWLREHLPPATEPTLVHGDLRLGNLMVDEGGLVALLDWEICHAGDGAEDLGWMCIRSWRFGADEHPALGVGTRQALLDAYAAA